MDKMREEFEAWANERGLDVDHIYVNGCFKCYCVSNTHSAFDIWKASRAALCVELPENCKGMALTVSELHRELDKAGVSYK